MKKLCLIDADSLIYINSWINRESDDFRVHRESIRDGFFRITSICESDYYCGFLTVGRNFRYNIGKIKEYKGQRKLREKPKFYAEYRKYLIEGLGCTYYEGLEADDLCKLATYKFKDTYNITIASPDKDLRQFVGRFYDYKKETFEIIDYDKALYNLWFQTLVGDSGDNIPGLYGIGKVKAEKLLKDIPTDNLGETVFKIYTETLGISAGLVSLAENFQLVYLTSEWDFGDSEPFNIVEIKDEVDW